MLSTIHLNHHGPFATAAPTPTGNGALWVDASDAATVAETAGSLDTITDKVNSMVGTPTGAGGADYPGALQNSLNTVDFDGSYLNFGAIPGGSGPSAATAFVVLNLTQTGTSTTLLNQGTAREILNITSGGTGPLSEAAGTPTYYLSGSVASWTNDGDVWTALQNQGTLLISITGLNLSTWTQYRIGNASPYEFDNNTRLMEFRVYTSALGTSDRQAIESELTTKWGL